MHFLICVPVLVHLYHTYLIWNHSASELIVIFYVPARLIRVLTPQRGSGQSIIIVLIDSVSFPPRYLPSFFIAHRAQHSHCSSNFSSNFGQLVLPDKHGSSYSSSSNASDDSCGEKARRGLSRSSGRSHANVVVLTTTNCVIRRRRPCARSRE